MASRLFDDIYLVTLLLSVTVGCDCHTPTNSSGVVVTYGGHSEVGNSGRTFYAEQNQPDVKFHAAAASRVEDHDGEVGSKVRDHNDAVRPSKRSTVTTEDNITDDGVVFVPNVKPVVRNEDLDDKRVGVADLMMRKLIGDVVEEKRVIVDTESPKVDVVFISGKNKERDGKEETVKKKSKQEKEADAEEKVVKKINCTNLDCDTNQEPVCGGKVEQKKWRYRMFLNRCFLTKVNCDFRNPVNRYRKVDILKCKDVALRSPERPKSIILHRTYQDLPRRPAQNHTRRSSPSRRSLNRGADGQFCSHSCPLSCTEEYDPQCAVSGAGQKLVFLNHCKLDFNSCAYGTAWHRRPLSWCVGGKMADARENRGFIAWMQRAGIVDRKGKLTLH